MLVFFTIMTCTSIVVIPSIEPGLDQELSMAKDNHVVKYFKVSDERESNSIPMISHSSPLLSSPLLIKFMADILSTGPPVYFVVTSGLDYMNETQQNYICGGVNCNPDSLSTQIYLASNYPDLYVITDFISC